MLDRVRRSRWRCRTSASRAVTASRILSENRPEWAIADFACLTAGMADVPIYPTLPAEQMVHILNDSGAVVMFVSTPEQAAKSGTHPTRCAGAAARDQLLLAVAGGLRHHDG